MKRRLLLWGMLLAAPWTAAGVTYPERPAEGAFLADEARVVSEAQAQEINQIASTLLRDLRIPLFAVTVRSLASHGAAGLTVDAYAQSLFDTWGIGSEQHNYGMLLFVALDDRAARIELGAAWGRSKDADMERIMTSLILPEMRAGRHGAGILAGVRGLDAAARGLGIPRPQPPWWSYLVLLGAVALVIGIIANLFRSGRSGWAWALIVALGVMLFFMLRSAANSRRGGAGGGFGGGFSGGGGATGRW